jgi:hypothetical protein
MFFSGGQLFLQQPSIFSFACLYQQPCYVTYKFAVHDYLWYLDLGNSSGLPYLSNGSRGFVIFGRAVIIILLSFAMDSFMLIPRSFQKRL